MVKNTVFCQSPPSTLTVDDDGDLEKNRDFFDLLVVLTGLERERHNLLLPRFLQKCQPPPAECGK